VTRLTVYSAEDPSTVLLGTADFDAISTEIDRVGARIERWIARRPIGRETSHEEVLLAYQPEIERLKRERGYTTADVVKVRRGDPNWPMLRKKFLAEHIHLEDEVRFFVEGSGAFYLHVRDRVLQVVGEAGDLLSVPKGTPHWFDGGLVGHFTCIRLFTQQEGWLAQYTGEQIADAFPRYNEAA